MAGMRLVAKCLKCLHLFSTEKLYTKEYKPNRECPSCGYFTLIKYWWVTKKVKVKWHNPAKYSNKAYDSHPLDGGIPFGEVPGDEQYTYLHDKNDPSYGKPGPTP